MKASLYLLLGFILSQVVASYESAQSCGCKNGMCTFSFPMPKSDASSAATEKLEKQLATLQAMTNAMYDEMVALATKVEKQDEVIQELKEMAAGEEEDEDYDYEEEPGVDEEEREEEATEEEGEAEVEEPRVPELKPGASVGCPPGWDRWNTSCYLLLEESFNWTFSADICQERGAHMVAIETAEEQEQIAALLKKYHIAEHVWTSGTAGEEAGQFLWNSTDVAMEYTNWAHGKPNSDARKRCVYLSRFNQWKWKNGPCAKHHIFVCERPVAEALG